MIQITPIRKQKLVILDGPDGTGKTTLAQGLAMQLQIPYFKVSNERSLWKENRFKEALSFYGPFFVDVVRQLGLSMVIDRGHPAEWVYSQVFNRETDMVRLRRIDDEFAMMGANIVITLRHDYSQNRDDDLVSKQRIPDLHLKYLEFAEWTRCNVIYIYVDSLGNDLKREVDALGKELQLDGPITNFATTIVINRRVVKRDISSLFSEETVGVR